MYYHERCVVWFVLLL